MRFKIITCAFLGLVISSTLSLAQSPYDFFRQFRGPIQAVKEWGRIAPPELACINQLLRQERGSVQALIQQGIPPSDSRLSSFWSKCRNQLTQPSPPTSPPNVVTPTSLYSVDGLALGSRVVFDSAVYKSYRCSPSEKFAGFTWCHRTSHERERRG